VVPLVLSQADTGASAAAPRDRAARSDGPGPTVPVTLPSWQLAVDRTASGPAAATPAQTSADVTQSAAPTTAPPAAPPTTTTTTAPPPPTTTTTTTSAPPPTTRPVPTAGREGVVTYYADPGGPGTCASPALPFGTVVTITDPDDGASVACTVDDREADSARQIDLDTATFAELAPLSQGVIDDAELSW
jgi:hypothetical protein